MSKSFQSHYGLILSHHKIRLLLSSCATFQSHYGLILSPIPRNDPVLRDFLSIPLWSDFIPTQHNNDRRWGKTFNPTMVWFYPEPSLPASLEWAKYIPSLSIPLWSDFIILRRSLLEIRRLLSIPLWSDFIPELAELFRSGLGDFQSHYGLILSKLWMERFVKPQAPFNPTMVWFYPAP